MDDTGGRNVDPGSGGYYPRSPPPDDGYGRGDCDGAMLGPKKVNLRVEIDTSPPFGSVKEAVTHFEGSGLCLPFHPLGIRHDYVSFFSPSIRRLSIVILFVVLLLWNKGSVA